jgi:hypothetical protein
MHNSQHGSGPTIRKQESGRAESSKPSCLLICAHLRKSAAKRLLSLGLSGPPLQARPQINFGLALQASVIDLAEPLLRFAVKLHHTVLHRLVIALDNVLQHDSKFTVFGHRKAHAVRLPFSRQARTSGSIAQVAKVA